MNLSEKRQKLFNAVKKLHPNMKWEWLFETIEEQDKEFIKELKGKYDHSMSWDKFTDLVNELAGLELTE